VPPKSPLESVSSIGSLGTVLNVLREVDIRPVRAAAEAPFTLAFVSRDQAFADYFAALVYRGERMHDVPPMRAAVSLPLNEPRAAALADIVVIITRDDNGANVSEELRLAKALMSGPEQVPVIVAFLSEGSAPPPLRGQWLPATLIEAPMVNGTLDEAATLKRIVKAVRARKVIDDIGLARHLPAFRNAVTKALIDEVAYSNATYSLGTGILSINPITGLPLNIADTVILTKNQGVLSYKIALAMGLDADFKTIMPKIAAVVGGGFMYRQVARGLAGLVPGLGVLPKIGIAFAGTYATGEAVRQWCINGEAINSSALKDVYANALERGKDIARTLIARRKSDGQNSGSRKIKTPRRGLLPKPGDEPPR
jgi:hypothetical protein